MGWKVSLGTCLVVVVLLGAAVGSAGGVGIAEFNSEQKDHVHLDTLLSEPAGEFDSISLGSDAGIQKQSPNEVRTDEGLLRQSGEVDAIVRSSDLDNLNTYAQSTRGVTIQNEFWLIEAAVVSIDTDRVPVEQLGYVEGVEYLHENVEFEHDASAAASGHGQYAIGSSGFESVDYNVVTGIGQINAPDVWDEFGTMGADTRVAVLDTGIDADHDDLDLFTEDPNNETYPGGWAEFDSSGQEIVGSTPHDTGTHGTHVSGTVAGADGSGHYIGAAPDAQLMHGLVLPDGSGTFSQILGGLEWAVENDADVVTMSLGQNGYHGFMIDAIEAAIDEEVVVIASVGNDGEGTSGSPGNEYDTIGVGAVDAWMDVADFSSGEKIVTDDAWGTTAPSHWPDEYIAPTVVAPGGSITMSAEPGNDYGYKQGTSMAAPHVAGTVALMQSATDEHHSPAEIREALEATAWKPDDWDPEEDAEDVLGDQDTRYGYGIIDAYNATAYLMDADPDPTSVVDAELNTSTIEAGESVAVEATVENEGNETETVTTGLEQDGSVVDTQSVEVDPDSTATATFERTYDEAGTYALAVNGTAAGDLEVLAPADLSVTEASMSDEEIEAGESIDVEATVANDGDVAGEHTAELVQDGDVVETETVEVDPGESETVTFEQTYDDPGTYELAVDDVEAGTLTVLSPADLSVTEAVANETEIEVGEPVGVEATIENAGEVAGTYTAGLEVDGDVVETVTVEVPGSETTTETLSTTFEASGTYSLAVNGTDAGDVEVLSSAALSVTGAETNETEIETGESVAVEATITNAGDLPGEHTAELFQDGTLVDEKTVDVDPGESESVTFEQTFDESGTYALSVDDVDAGDVTVLDPADLSVTGASVSDEEIEVGESIDVDVTVTNDGDVVGEHTVELEENGEIVDEATVEVDPGASETVTFERTYDDPGTYDLAADGIDAGAVSVLEPADLFVADAEVDPTEIEVGETVTVEATVANDGEVAGEHTAELIEDGAVVDEKTVEVEPGEEATVTFEKTYDESGSYELVVDDVDAGTLVVLAPADLSVTDAEVDPTEIEVGESVTVEATVANDGDVAGEHTAVLLEDGDVIDEETVEVEPDASETITFERTYDEAGTYELAVDDVDAGTLDVVGGSAFVVIDASVSDGQITPGETVTVDAEVENVGDEPGEHTVELVENGDVVETKAISLEPGESTSMSFDRSYTQPGTYTLAVDDTTAGTVTVLAPADLSVTDATTSETEIDVGESVTVEATVENTGDEPGDLTVDLEENGSSVDSETVSVAPGGSETVTFERTYDDSGTYDLAVDGVDAGELMVIAPATFVIGDVSIEDNPFHPDDTLVVETTVENVGDSAGSETVSLEIDGSSLADETVDLDAGESTTVSLTVSDHGFEPGEYSYLVEAGEDAESGTIEFAAEGGGGGSGGGDDGDEDDGDEGDDQDGADGSDEGDGDGSSGSGDGPATQDGIDDSSGSDGDTDGTDVDDTVGVIGDGADTGGDGEQIPGFGFGVAIVALLIVGVGYRLAPISAN